MLNRRKHYWFVWNQDGNHLPRFRHRAEALAIMEAKRLSALHPGQTFHVMKVIGKAKHAEWLPFGEA